MTGDASTLLDFSHSASRRVPMRYRLGTGLKVEVKSQSQHATFWDIFSSPEYFSMLTPLQVHLDDLHVSDLMLLDCGAGVGMLPLFLEHCYRLGVLRAHIREYHCVEASLLLAASLRHNLGQLANAHQYTGGVGRRVGARAAQTVPCVDVWPLLQGRNILLKLTLPGGEAAFLSEYGDALHNVVALLVEQPVPGGDWRRVLRQYGFAGLPAPRELDRPVELYLRSMDHKGGGR